LTPLGAFEGGAAITPLLELVQRGRSLGFGHARARCGSSCATRTGAAASGDDQRRNSTHCGNGSYAGTLSSAHQNLAIHHFPPSVTHCRAITLDGTNRCASDVP
jgi:hypothetical protein